jgi:hypothetical protein
MEMDSVGVGEGAFTTARSDSCVYLSSLFCVPGWWARNTKRWSGCLIAASCSKLKMLSLGKTGRMTLTMVMKFRVKDRSPEH